MEYFPDRMRRNSDVSPAAYQRPASGVGGSTQRGGIDPGDYRFRPRFVGVVDVWKDSSSGDRTLSFPGSASSTNLRQSVTSSVEFVPTPCGAVPTRGERHFRPRCVGVVNAWGCLWWRGWYSILADRRRLHELPPISDRASVVGGPTLCGAISTRWTIVFVPGVLRL